MGEYAKRKIDGVEIKIGTCENMYYSRYEQKNDFVYGYSTKNLFWRLPFPKEDGIQVGDYEFDDFGLADKDNALLAALIGWPFDETDKVPEGKYYISDEKSGIRLQLKCYHNKQLPQGSDDVKVAFFGCSKNVFQIESLTNKEDGLKVVFRCSLCKKAWIAEDWNEIEKFLIVSKLKDRLFEQIVSYHAAHDLGNKLFEYTTQIEERCGFGNTTIHTIKLKYNPLTKDAEILFDDATAALPINITPKQALNIMHDFAETKHNQLNNRNI